MVALVSRTRTSIHFSPLVPSTEVDGASIVSVPLSLPDTSQVGGWGLPTAIVLLKTRVFGLSSEPFCPAITSNRVNSIRYFIVLVNQVAVKGGGQNGNFGLYLGVSYPTYFVLNIYNANNHSTSPTGRAPVVAAKKVNYEKYVDPSGEFTGQELKYGFWYVRHRLLLYRILVGTLMALAAGTAFFSLFALGKYLIFGLQESAEVDRGLTSFENYTVLNSRFAAKPLEVLSTAVYSGGVGKYDLVADVVNSNPRFLVTFDYYFSFNGTKTPSQTTTLLPRENRPVAYLGLSADTYPDSAVLTIDNIAWKRLSNREFLDPETWQRERLNFLVSNFEFIPQFDESGANAEIIRFTLTNQSAYSYKTARFYVGLYLDQNLVGLLPLSLDNFTSLASKNIDLRSFGSNLSVNEVKIFPLVNVYDDAVYLPPEK